MKAVALAGVGIAAGGLAGWEHARAALLGDAAFVPVPFPQPVVAGLPATERRRANATSRWALAAASEAAALLAPDAVSALSTVFASADGDGEVLTAMLRELAADRVALSPTTFHNSVFNAPAGYWSIAAAAPAASVTLCAGHASFAAGLIEAATQATLGDTAVLLVAYDLPFPEGAPIGTPVREPFACALLLAPGEGSTRWGRLEALAIARGFAAPHCEAPGMAVIRSRFAGNPAAEALPLLAAIARREPSTLALPYLEETHLRLRWSP